MHRTKPSIVEKKSYSLWLTITHFILWILCSVLFCSVLFCSVPFRSILYIYITVFLVPGQNYPSCLCFNRQGLPPISCPLSQVMFGDCISSLNRTGKLCCIKDSNGENKVDVSSAEQYRKNMHIRSKRSDEPGNKRPIIRLNKTKKKVTLDNSMQSNENDRKSSEINPKSDAKNHHYEPDKGGYEKHNTDNRGNRINYEHDNRGQYQDNPNRQFPMDADKKRGQSRSNIVENRRPAENNERGQYRHNENRGSQINDNRGPHRLNENRGSPNYDKNAKREPYRHDENKGSSNYDKKGPYRQNDFKGNPRNDGWLTRPINPRNDGKGQWLWNFNRNKSLKKEKQEKVQTENQKKGETKPKGQYQQNDNSFNQRNDGTSTRGQTPTKPHSKDGQNNQNKRNGPRNAKGTEEKKVFQRILRAPFIRKKG